MPQLPGRPLDRQGRQAQRDGQSPPHALRGERLAVAIAKNEVALVPPVSSERPVPDDALPLLVCGQNAHNFVGKGQSPPAFLRLRITSLADGSPSLDVRRQVTFAFQVNSIPCKRPPKLSARQQRELARMAGTGEYTIADLAEVFTVSRATVYRTLQRSPAADAAR